MLSQMKRLTAIPLIVSSLRIGVLPIIIFFYATWNIDLSLAVFAFAAATDLMDGYLARKMDVTSKFGAYYDGATDFVLITGIYAFLISKAIYPIWLLLLIITSFGQFLASSLLYKKTLRPYRQIHRQRSLSRHSLNTCFPNSGRF